MPWREILSIFGRNFSSVALSRIVIIAPSPRATGQRLPTRAKAQHRDVFVLIFHGADTALPELESRQAERGEHDGEDPEPDDDGAFLPAF